MIGDEEMNQFSRRDINWMARRMRPVLRDIEVVESEGEVYRVPIVEPVRPGKCEGRGETVEQQGSGQRIS